LIIVGIANATRRGREDLAVELLDLGKTPISVESPAGQDARAGAEFDALAIEFEKLSSPTASSGMDWQKIADLSAKILAEQAKDLLVACYLCTALLRLEQLRGFAKGLHVIRDLLDHFWETLYPAKKRMRGRSNAVEWWQEKIISFLESAPLSPLPEEEMAALRGDLDAVDGFLGENMEGAPSLAGLSGILSSYQTAEEEKKQEPVQAAPPVTPPGSPPVKAAAPRPAAPETSPAIQVDGDAGKALKAGLGKLAEIADFYMSRDLSRPLAYRLQRIAAWTSVEEVPPNTDSRTLIPSPPEHVKTAMVTMYGKADWEELLKTAEARVGEFLFWLDLGRYSAEALQHLGHGDIADQIARETAFYVGRLKGIESLCFSDGTPFADEATREWLRRETLPSGLEQGAGIMQASVAGAGSLEARMVEDSAKARAMLREKKVGDAAELLHSRVRASRSARERLLWRLALCDLLVSAGRERTALPHLETALQELDLYRVEEWDPDMALQALMRVYSGWRAQKGEAAQGKAAEILDRIARLDPAAAVKMGG
jgi:type VI secretion system protein VasJ